jgi:hypothetical protein
MQLDNNRFWDKGASFEKLSQRHQK